MFVHLHVHSHYSLLNSTIRLRELCRTVAEQGAPAVALTDDANLFGAVEFCKEASDAGLKPIVGCDLHVSLRPERADGSAAKEQAPARLVVLAENETGYQNLCRIVSQGYLDSDGKLPVVSAELLERNHEGLISLCGGLAGEVGLAATRGRRDQAEENACRLRDIFGADRFFLELQSVGLPQQPELNTWLAELAPRIGVGLVASNDCRFLAADDFEAHRALTCIGAGTTLDDPSPRPYTREQYLRSPAEMAEVFRDYPAALEATAEIAERCDYRITPREPLLPDFDVPEGESIASALREYTRKGLDERRQEAERAPAGSRRDIAFDEYEQRLKLELDVICEMGFPGYFLIVWDMVRYAREHGIPVGPGRGSAAGSLVAYALRITDVDPLQHDLLFERFLNPERKSLPDIDIDFCQRRRGEVIRYVQQKYGEDHVAQIITFGALNARSVIRDVGRVMNMTFGECDRIAKLVPEELGVTLDKALKDSPALEELRQSDARVRQLLATAQSLEGLARNPGVHAAGVIIAPQPLIELAPLYKTGRDEVTTQFAKDEAESVGLLKVDFLGLKTLTVLTDALESIERAGHDRIDLDALPPDDSKTFELFQRARTSGVFQFESSGMREVLRKLKPETYDDLTALNALYRPGPLQSGMIDDFINRRHGKVKVSYPHPSLQPILEPTYGVMVFQEQVMRVAVDLAGFSLGEADNLRKAMGKKKVEVMEAQKEKFVSGSVERGTDQAKATEIFELMAYFAGYGFNKSHSAAYALVAYWCGYLKAHYPAHFMAALLTSERENTTKVVRYRAECSEMGIEVLPPDVNESDVDFTAVGEDKIRFGLSAIKGVGRGAVESILSARRTVGRFESLFGFCTEIDLRLNNKKVLEALVKAGALDSLGAGRSTLVFSLDTACEKAQATRADRETGQGSLFGDDSETPGQGEAPPPPLTPMPEWSKSERLKYEKEVLGFYVSGHPLDDHADALASITSAQIGELAEHAGRELTVVGIVTALRKTRTRKGDWMAFATIDDQSGHAEVIVFPDAWKECESVVLVDAPLCIKGTVEVDGERGKVLAKEVTPLGSAQQEAAQGLLVRLPNELSSEALDDALGRAAELLASSPGTCPVNFRIAVAELGEVTVRADRTHRVDPSTALIDSLEQLVGTGRVSLMFG